MSMRCSIVGLLMLFTLGACTGEDTEMPDRGPRPLVDDVPTDVVDEMTVHDGKVCPKQLAQGEEPGHGFGALKTALVRPSLLEPDAAWVCEYYPLDAGPAADGSGIRFEWVREGRASPVGVRRLPALARDLAKLAPPLQEQLSCTDDLGSRWMLVYSHDKDLTGVVVDDFGCGHVRLTDDPFSTEPGAGSQGGTVPGVLVGPVSLLAAMKTVQAETSATSDPAVWRFGPGQSLQPSSSNFTALVRRVDCNSGVTGLVLAPEIHLSESRVVVTFSVAPSPPGGGRCQSNDEVAYQVQLGEPLEGRPLVDGRCLRDAEGEYASFCAA